jgi:hypothetical protein
MNSVKSRPLGLTNHIKLSVKSNGRFFVIQKENYEKDLWVCANFYKEAEYG